MWFISVNVLGSFILLLLLYILHESECDIYPISHFHEPERGTVKVKPESEISSHTTPTKCNKWFIPH